MGEIKTI